MIGTSTGEVYEDSFHHALSTYGFVSPREDKNTPLEAPKLAAGAVREGIRYPPTGEVPWYRDPIHMMKSGVYEPTIKGDEHIIDRTLNPIQRKLSPNIKDDEDLRETIPQTYREDVRLNIPHIDRDHDVPYLAGALEHPEHGFYGIAMDKRIPHHMTVQGVTFPTETFIGPHEYVEHRHMKETGEKYEEAHSNVATPHEKNLVMAFAKEHGKDPESFWNDYNNQIQGWARSIKDIEPESVHPHLYLGPYEGTKLAGILDRIKSFWQGTKEYEKAPSLSAYPSEQEAFSAKRAGFGYESPYERYMTGDVARILGIDSKSNFTPVSASGLTAHQAAITGTSKFSKNIELQNNPEAKIAMRDTYMRAALAANRIPIAALGFDPSRTAMDIKIGSEPSLSGAYSPSRDSMYVAALAHHGSAAVHESVHRGLELLRKTRPDLKEAFDRLPDEESVVRYLMATQSGDPEKGVGDIADIQRNLGIIMFSGFEGNERRKALDQITKAAQEEIAKKKGMSHTEHLKNLPHYAMDIEHRGDNIIPFPWAEGAGIRGGGGPGRRGIESLEQERPSDISNVRLHPKSVPELVERYTQKALETPKKGDEIFPESGKLPSLQKQPVTQEEWGDLQEVWKEGKILEGPWTGIKGKTRLGEESGEKTVTVSPTKRYGPAAKGEEGIKELSTIAEAVGDESMKPSLENVRSLVQKYPDLKLPKVPKKPDIKDLQQFQKDFREGLKSALKQTIDKLDKVVKEGSNFLAQRKRKGFKVIEGGLEKDEAKYLRDWTDQIIDTHRKEMELRHWYEEFGEGVPAEEEFKPSDIPHPEIPRSPRPRTIRPEEFEEYDPKRDPGIIRE
jgi:hypothetical protein